MTILPKKRPNLGFIEYVEATWVEALSSTKKKVQFAYCCSGYIINKLDPRKDGGIGYAKQTDKI